MQLPRHLKKAVGQARLWIERGRLFPPGMTNVMLLRAQAHLLPGYDITKALIAPGACQLTGDPGMCRLANRDAPLSSFTIKHFTSPYRYDPHFCGSQEK